MCVIKAHLRGGSETFVTFKAKSKFVYPTAPDVDAGLVYIKWYPCRVYDHRRCREPAEPEWDCVGLTSEGTVILYDIRTSEEVAVRRVHNLVGRISFLQYSRLKKVFNPIKLCRPDDVVMSIKVCVL